MRRFMLDAAQCCFATLLLAAGLYHFSLAADESPPAANQPSAPKVADEKPSTPEQIARNAKFVERNKLWDEALRLQGAGQTAESIATAEKMLAIERELLGPEDADLGYSASWIAKQCEQLGDFRAATAYRREQLTAYRAVHGEDHWQTRTARLCLADDEQLLQLSPDKLQRLQRAETLLSDAIRLRREIKLPESLAAAEEALIIRREVLGTAHRLYASSLTEQARAFSTLQQYQRAAECYEQAIACERKVLGDHPDVASTLNLLANLQYERGNYPRAEQLHQQAADIRGRLLGKESLEYAGSIGGLGLVYSTQGNFPKAEPLFKEAIAIRQARQATQSAAHATVLNNLGCLYIHMRDYPRASL